MINKTLIACSLALILTGCGGGGGDTSTGQTPAPTPTPTPTEPVVVNTGDLVAEDNFTFRTDIDLTLSLATIPPGSGVVNVYHDYDFHDVVNDIYYPNYLTRVISFHPETTTSVEFQVSKNWEHLVVEFVPTNASGVEMYKKLDLSNETTLEFEF